MYQIGKITNTHGIKGEVKIYNLSDFNRFFVGAKIYVMLQGKKVEFVPLMTDSLVLIVGSKHRWRNKDFISLRQLITYNLQHRLLS